VNAGQYEGIVGRLDAILSKMPAAPVYDPGPAAPEPQRAARPVAPHSLAEEGRQAASLALYTMLTVLDDWISGAQDNHVALEHRGRENRGEECWRSFAPSDIRIMINDAARELGLSEFPTPETAREDVAQ
jgi:hypothetical protein